MHLDLVLPDLLLPSDAPAALRAARLPHLERWLARADFTASAAGGRHGWIGERYGLAAPVPYAAIALTGEGEAAEGPWLRADPVHLRVDTDATVLHDPAILGLERAEADALLANLQAHFAQDGLELRAPAPHRWYVRVPEGELPRTVALDAAMGRNIFGMLPEGSGRIRWRSLLTEAQMILGAHEVNARRAIAANSVWFWGEGTLPASIAAAYRHVFADDVFVRGLARLSGAAAHALPPTLDGVPDLPEEGFALVVVDALTAALRGGDATAWLARASALDQDWFASLPRALARFESVRIVLPGDGGTRIATLTRAARWRWFRAAKPLSAHA